MIVNFINTSKYDSSNDKSIKKLFSSITDNIFNQLDSGEIKPIKYLIKKNTKIRTLIATSLLWQINT